MSDSSRLSRWSQRKLAVRQGERKLATHKGGALPEPDEIAPNKELDNERKPAGGQALAPADQSSAVVSENAEMLSEADLPPIEELSAQSDYTVFLKKNVPEALRRRALRKLWVSDPVLANLDGLNDYDDDYSIVQAITMDDTIYKIGRGLLGDEPEPKELELAAEEAALPITQGEPVDSSESAVGSDTAETIETAADELATPGEIAAPPTAADTQTRQVGESEPRDGNERGPDDAKSGLDSAI